MHGSGMKPGETHLQEESRAIFGVWILDSSYTERVDTGERPPQSERRGVLILHPDGRMVAVLTPAVQPAATSESEQAAAFRASMAYSGRYRLEPPDRFVTDVDISLWPSWVGGDQPRRYVLKGDRLDIVSGPARLIRFGDFEVNTYLSWRRESR